MNLQEQSNAEYTELSVHDTLIDEKNFRNSVDFGIAAKDQMKNILVSKNSTTAHKDAKLKEVNDKAYLLSLPQSGIFERVGS